MEESTSWVTYAIIILAVIVVVGIVVLKFYPETFTDISNIAKETFKIGEDEKKAEASQRVIATTIDAIMECLEKELDNCGCELKKADLEKLPDGYKIFMQNRIDETDPEKPKSVLITAIDKNEGLIGKGQVMQPMQISIAVHEKWVKNGKKMEGILCRTLEPYNIRTWNTGTGEEAIPDEIYETFNLEKSGNQIVVKAGTYGPYNFFHEGMILSMYKRGNNICFVTKAIEEEAANAGDLTGNNEMVPLLEFEEGNDIEYLKRQIDRVSQGLFRIPRCEGAAGMDYSITWPVALDEIKGLNSCGSAPAGFSREIKINVNEGSDVIMPLSYGVVTDYCEEGCGEEGKSVTIYELHSGYEKYSETGRIVGRVVKIAGLKSINEANKVKAEINRTGFRGGAILKAGDIIGSSTGAITLMETYKRNAEVEGGEDWILKNLNHFIGNRRTEEEIQKAIRSPEILLCMLPTLPSEYYAGTCAVTSFDRGSECRGIDWGSLTELANELSIMQEGGLYNMMMPICRHCRIALIGKNNTDRGAPCHEATTEEVCHTSEEGTQCEQVVNPRSPSCNLPHRCPEGKTCVCEQKDPDYYSVTELQRQTYDLRESRCVQLPSYGFEPVFASGVVDSGDSTSKNIWMQRAGNTLAICENPPCIR